MKFINHSKIQFHIIDSTFKALILLFAIDSIFLAYQEQTIGAAIMLCAAIFIAACHRPFTKFFDFKAFVEQMAAIEKLK